MSKLHRPPGGFTLVELLVVLAIMAILAALSVPAVTSILRSSSLTSGAQALNSQLNIARQYAMAKDCLVEFRIYELPDPTTTSTTPTIFRGFQSFAVPSDGSADVPITKASFLPAQLCMVNNTTYSSILGGTSTPLTLNNGVTGVNVGNYPPASYKYYDFHFKPDGSTDLNPISTTTWFVSLASLPLQSATGLPAINFVTLQINATTGRVASYRPN